MLRELHRALSPVRSRLTWRRAAAALATGLVVGGWLALVAGLMALLGRSYWAGVAGVVAVVSVPLAMLLKTLLQPATWNEAAQAVDRHFQLHDRTSTAIYLTAHASGDPLEAMQIEDAAARLAPLALRQAAPWALPWQRLAGGILLSGFALALIAAGMLLPDLRSLRGSAPVVVEQGADVVERKVVEPIAIDQSIARRSTALAPAANDRSGLSTADDVAWRYFDRLQAPPKPSRKP